MPRRLLIINESHLLRKMAASYVQVEMADVVIETAWYADDALRLLQQEKFDVILAAMDLAPLDGIEVHQRLRRDPGPNQETPYIIMAAVNTPELRERLQEAGIVRSVFAPYTAHELARAINEVSDPRILRRHNRCSVEGGRVEIHFSRISTTMNVVNISRRGMLTEFGYREEVPIPWRIGTAQVSLPDQKGIARIDDISMVVARIWVVNWADDHIPQTMRAAWKFTKVPDQAAETLDRILSRVQGINGGHICPDDEISRGYHPD